MAAVTCAYPDCDHEAERGDLCEGHAKQRQQGRPLAPLRDDSRSPLELLCDAARDYADADSDDDEEWKRALTNLRKIVVSYALRCAEVVRELRPVGRPRKFSDERILEAIEKGGSVRGAARILGISDGTVRYRVSLASGARTFRAVAHSSRRSRF